MKSAALPAAEPSDTRAKEPVRLKLVQPREELSRAHPKPVHDKPETADDLEDMWDNMPV